MARVSAREAEEIIATAAELADAAREATLLHFRKPGLTADNKEIARFDPVTVADRLSEERMRAILAQRRPQDGILGEEYGSTAGTSGLTWVLDPIDGTRGYLSGTPTWGVLISVADETGPVYGLIDQPYIGERFSGDSGSAHYSGPSGERRLTVRRCASLMRCHSSASGASAMRWSAVSSFQPSALVAGVLTAVDDAADACRGRKPGRQRFALLPDGKDPDDLVRAEGAGAFRAVLAEVAGRVPVVVGASVASWALSTVKPASLGVTRMTGAPWASGTAPLAMVTSPFEAP